MPKNANESRRPQGDLARSRALKSPTIKAGLKVIFCKSRLGKIVHSQDQKKMIAFFQKIATDHLLYF
jgi:hypothetical protein